VPAGGTGRGQNRKKADDAADGAAVVPDLDGGLVPHDCHAEQVVARARMVGPSPAG